MDLHRGSDIEWDLRMLTFPSTWVCPRMRKQSKSETSWVKSWSAVSLSEKVSKPVVIRPSYPWALVLVRTSFHQPKCGQRAYGSKKIGFFQLNHTTQEEVFFRHPRLIGIGLPFSGFPSTYFVEIWATTMHPLLCFVRLMVNWDWRELFCLNPAPPFVSSWPHTESFKRVVGGSVNFF